jgi:hypothetical protein
MYAAVPRITPARVCPIVSVGELVSDDARRLVFEYFGQTEVENSHHAVGSDLDVGGLQVPPR